jgi:hypothetical protein
LSEGTYETVSFIEVSKADRLDAEHYDPAARALLRKFDPMSVMPLGSFIEAKPERFRKSLFKEIFYIDISSVDNKTGLITPTVVTASAAPSRAAYLVLPGDVLVSTVRPDRNVVALITGAARLPMVASNGFCVLRPRAIESEVLFAYCKTESFKQMLTRHATASMYPTVTDKDVLGIPFLAPSPDVTDRVKKLIRSGLDMMEKAQQQLTDAVALMSEHIQEPYAIQRATSNEAPQVQEKRKIYRIKKRKR